MMAAISGWARTLSSFRHHPHQEAWNTTKTL
jgi:hypothetical protein